MEKSNHRNYVEWFERDWPLLVKNQIIPNEKNIFDLFSQKFKKDAEADLNRGRKILRRLWNLCANSCLEIHQILSWESGNNPKLSDLVKNIVNLDYESLGEIFSKIQDEYTSQEIKSHLQDVCDYIDKMRKISKNHTNVISKSK